MTDHPNDDDLLISPVDRPLGYVPNRVVSLVPSLTESLYDLDLGDRLIAVTDYCVRPANAVECSARVGGTKNPDIERIIELQPDLILLNDEENRRVDAEILHHAGIPIWVTRPRSISDALNLLWDIMAVFDHGVMSARVREIERAYDYQQASVQTITPVRVFVPVWRDPWITFTNQTYMHDVVRVCGGFNVFSDYETESPSENESMKSETYGTQGSQHYPRITAEDIINAHPELVLLPDEPYQFEQVDGDFFHQLDIPAARTGRIIMVDGSLLSWYGTRTGYALRDLPGIIMGEFQQDGNANDTL